MPMKTSIRPMAIATLAAISAIGPAAGQSDTDLGQKLEIRHTQSGIAGESGTQWTILPTGQWNVQRIESGKPVATHASGSLQPDQIETLKKVLNANHPSDLPATIGGYARANPQKITIRYGDHSSTLVMQGGDDAFKVPDGATAGAPPAQGQIVEIAKQVKKLTVEQ
ncbi:hypothetical protein MXD81_31345 [Microbacteriaceae bacterium K1510]|nr:hypothetical protein [Microbacteriaceae bacterium K1510]